MTRERHSSNENPIYPSIVSEIKKQAPKFPNIQPKELAEKLGIRIVENVPYQQLPGLLFYQNKETTLLLKEETNAIQERIIVARSFFYFLHLQQKNPNTNFFSEIHNLDSKSSTLDQINWDNETIEQYLLPEKIVEETYKNKKQNDLKGVISQMSEFFLLPTDMIKNRLSQLHLVTLEESLVIKTDDPSIIDMCQPRENYQIQT